MRFGKRRKGDANKILFLTSFSKDAGGMNGRAARLIGEELAKDGQIFMGIIGSGLSEIAAKEYKERGGIKYIGFDIHKKYWVEDDKRLREGIVKPDKRIVVYRKEYARRPEFNRQERDLFAIHEADAVLVYGGRLSVLINACIALKVDMPIAMFRGTNMYLEGFVNSLDDNEEFIKRMENIYCSEGIENLVHNLMERCAERKAAKKK
jgi:hypothetical protein